MLTFTFVLKFPHFDNMLLSTHFLTMVYLELIHWLTRNTISNNLKSYKNGYIKKKKHILSPMSPVVSPPTGIHIKQARHVAFEHLVLSIKCRDSNDELWFLDTVTPLTVRNNWFPRDNIDISGDKLQTSIIQHHLCSLKGEHNYSHRSVHPSTFSCLYNKYYTIQTTDLKLHRRIDLIVEQSSAQKP